MRRTLVVVMIASLFLAGCSGDGGSGQLECVDGDYPGDVSPERVANSIDEDWQANGDAPLVVPNSLDGYEAATSARVKSPVDGDEFILGIFRYGSAEEASSKGTFRHAQEGQLVISRVGTGSNNASLDAEGEEEAMLMSAKCITQDEIDEGTTIDV